ncbi:MAG: DUF368 domain-containing protein [Chloroflexi bacterium]|nr:DUF368 domain-containing protein [Chloroflexota bacterium]
MHWIGLVLKGILYGTTHVVPGIGGGIVLILLGVYADFVEAIGNILVRRDRWRQYLRFLIPLGVGMVLGVFLAAVAVEGLMARYPTASMLFFMGLLLGTIPSVFRLSDDMRPTKGRVAACLAGAAFVVAIRALEPLLAGSTADFTLTTPREIGYNALMSFLAGGASVTPGLDGSYVLLLGGTYPAVLGAVAQLRHLQIHWAALISTAVPAGLGILGFSKVIDSVIKRSPSGAYYAVLGMIVGSIYGLWPQPPIQGSPLVLALCLIAGATVAIFIGRVPQEPGFDEIS